MFVLKKELREGHARRSLMLARISAITSAFAFAPCGPPW
jgi:hypothetical protein